MVSKKLAIPGLNIRASKPWVWVVELLHEAVQLARLYSFDGVGRTSDVGLLVQCQTSVLLGASGASST